MTDLTDKIGLDFDVSDRASDREAGLNGHEPALTVHVGAPQLSMIIPTRNEAPGIASLIERLREAISVPCELIFVDDSDDTTPFEVQLQERQASPADLARMEIRLLHRPAGYREGGLGTAVQEGMRLARGPWMCVMDADLQHPPEVVERLLAKAESEGLDLVVGSRYVEGGSLDTMSGVRRGMSWGCARAAKAVFPLRLRAVSDPLSGFFLMRRSSIDPERLEPHGFKILLEVLGRHPKLRIGEVGFEFADRYAGLSKASGREALRFTQQLASLRFTHPKPVVHRQVAFYNIHDVLTVSSEVVLPELKPFRVRTTIINPDIALRVTTEEVRTDKRPAEVHDLTTLNPRIRYSETFGEAGFAVQVDLGARVEVTVSEFVASSPHVVYTNVLEPIIRWKLVAHGYALVHAAGFVMNGVTHLITARTDTGKTTTMLKILEKEGTSFISDDLILVDRTGMALAYPKPLTISAHTVAALHNTDLNRIERLFLPIQSRLHSRTGRQFAFFLSSRRIPVATLNTFVQRLLPPPKYRVDKLVPGVRVEQAAPIGSLSIIQRGTGEAIAPLDNAEGITLLRENCEDAFGFPPYEHLARLLKRDAQGNDLGLVEEQIVRAAFGRVPMRLVTSDRMGWAELIWGQCQSETNGHRHHHN